MRTRGCVLITNATPPERDPHGVTPGGCRLMRTVRRTRRRSGAFTLIEILITLSILVTLVAIAAPRWGSASARYKADALARRIAADIERTRTLAVTTSKEQALKFDVGGNRYLVNGLTSLDRASSDTDMQVGDSPYGGTLERAEFSGTATLSFNGFGLPRNFGELIFAVGNERRRITVAEETGIVTIYRVRPKADGSTLGSTVFDVLKSSVVVPGKSVVAAVEAIN